MEIKINVKDVFTDSYVTSWAKDTDLFLFLIDLSHTYTKEISSPDLQSTGSGLSRCAKNKSLGYNLFRAINNKTVKLQNVGQRKGYKAYIFTF